MTWLGKSYNTVVYLNLLFRVNKLVLRGWRCIEFSQVVLNGIRGERGMNDLLVKGRYF